jgi:hypothetical protein
MWNTDLAITLDVDWAPDFAIEFAVGLLLEQQVRATWFITHDSPAIQALRQFPDLFELGIHPNFLPGSTHGATPDDVLSHCLSIVPEAQSVRTHSLVQSSPLLQKIINETELQTDVSVFLPLMPNITPVKVTMGGRALLRVPYLWEDSYEILQESPDWQLEKLTALGPGFKVVNFHPIHIYLNSPTILRYQRMRREVSPMADWTSEVAAPYVERGAPGVQTMFRQMLEFLKRKRSWLVCDVQHMPAFISTAATSGTTEAEDTLQAGNGYRV